MLSYFTDLQGSQTYSADLSRFPCLVTLLIYKVLKHKLYDVSVVDGLVTLLIYKVLKRVAPNVAPIARLVTLLIYKVLKPCGYYEMLSLA